VAWLTGACIAAPRDVLVALGPFDRAIHMYAEDMDLCLRARQAGVPSVFRPEVSTVIHHGKASSSQAYADLGRSEAARNGRAVLRRAYGRRRETLAWAAERVNVGIRARAKALLGRDASWERLVAAGLRRAEPVPVLADAPRLLPDPSAVSPPVRW
jgi:GT2 family glycosyltransferase